MDPDVRFGKPCISGTRIDVATIVSLLSAGETIDTVAEEHALTPGEVRSALEYVAHAIAHVPPAVRHGVPRGGTMNFKPLDIVVLNKDLPRAGLKLGDLGAVVEVYAPDALEVEFVTASGKTEALLTLDVSDVRSVVDTDLVSVRPYSRTA